MVSGWFQDNTHQMLIACQGFLLSEIIVASIPQSRDECVVLTLSDCGTRFKISKVRCCDCDQGYRSKIGPLGFYKC